MNVLELLQIPYPGTMTITERLEALERSLTLATEAAKHLHAFIDAMVAAIEVTHQERIP